MISIYSVQMIAKVCSAAVNGIDAVPVDVEVASRSSERPRTIIVGLPDAAVRESSERVQAALMACGFYVEDGTHVVNLAPADLKKEGPSFDFPIAIGMVICGLKADLFAVDEYLIVGELSLDGLLRPVKGILSIAAKAKECGIRKLLVPAANASEAALIGGIEVYGAESLSEGWNHLTSKTLLPVTERPETMKTVTYSSDFSEVKGQAHVKRALEIAAAGGHNILLSGPPGTGKSMLAQRIPTILPELSEQEAIETTKIHSIAGMLTKENSFVVERPYRAPHHTISDAGLLGGGSIIAPGEVSKANNGVLFLDELPEFRRTTLEVLRQPLEDGHVTIARASGTLQFPSEFVLVAAMNPCPCGYYGAKTRQCTCSPRQIELYRNRISGPLLDRIDLQVEVPLIDYKQLSSTKKEESSLDIRKRVVRARERQKTRMQPTDNKEVTNATMSPKSVQQYCRLEHDGHVFFERAMRELNFSGRGHNRILKVARTIADLQGVDQIQVPHLMEAIQLRSLERQS